MTRAEGGKVYLVGAGPGDPELLTRKAATLLESADVVLHDDLVAPSILALVGPGTLVASVGKRCGKKKVSQTAIQSLMIACARNGMSVVRLKSGDPLLFGRAGEEIEALQCAGVPLEVVPGITAAFAAAAAARISLTDRRKASHVTFATGHLAEADADPDYWIEIARAKSTLVMYMPGPDLGAVSRHLVQAGLPAETPCLLLSRASLEGQREQRVTLAELGHLDAVESPSILIVGEVTRVLPEIEQETAFDGQSLERELTKYIDPSTSALPQGGIARRSG